MTALDDLCATPFHLAGDAGRARILSRLADTELHVALTSEPSDDLAEARTFDLDGLKAAVATDAAERLSGFFGAPVAFAAMPGRALAAMLAPAGTALLVNPGQPSEMFLNAETLAWLGVALAARPQEDAAQPEWTHAPLPEAVTLLAGPLGERLGDMHGLMERAALVSAGWPDGRRGHLLLLAGVEDRHRSALAKAMAELLAFLPPLEGGVDIGFAPGDLPKAALILEVPAPPAPEPPARRDPNAPPILR